MQQSRLRGRKIAQGHGTDPEKEKRIVIVGAKLQFAFKFPPCLRIGFLAAKLKNGVAEQGMRVGIFWIELDSFTKLDDCRFRKMRDGVRAPKQDVKGSGISHGFLQVLKPLLGVSQTLGLEVGNAEKVRTLKICLECNRGLQIAHSGVKISAVEVDSPKHILRARVTRIIRCDCLRKLTCFLDITSTKP